MLRRLLFLPEQASSIARDIDTLHYVVIGATILGAFAITALATFYLTRYSADGEQPPQLAPAPDPDRPTRSLREVIIIVGLLTLFTGFWVVGFRQFVRLQTPPDEAIPIYAIGKQWMWSFAYPNGAGSKGVLYVPAGRPVKLLLTSRDVIHSVYVPAFRIKQDVIPGRMTSAWFSAERPGRFDLLCAEYCGLEHSRMRATVVVLPEAAFQKRLQQLVSSQLVSDLQPIEADAEPAGAVDMIEQGKRAAVKHGCLRCHTLDDTPHIGPSWAGVYGSTIALRNGSKAPVDEAYLTRSMMDPMQEIRAGYPPVMPSYQGLLSAAEAGAIVELIRSLQHVPTAQRSPLPARPLPSLSTDSQDDAERPGAATP